MARQPKATLDPKPAEKTGQQITAEISTFREQLQKQEPEILAALPPQMPVDRFVRVLLTAVQNNAELLACTRRSLFNAVMHAAQDGLLPDGREGAMVVRFGKGGKEASWQPMILGIRKKARNSGEITDWQTQVVHAEDVFDFDLGDQPFLTHRFDLKADRGPIIGAYSICEFKDGGKSREVMSIKDIIKIRDRSDAWKAYTAQKIKSTPWATDESEMCRKTVARRHAKVLPLSADLDRMLRRDDEMYEGEGKPDAQQVSRLFHRQIKDPLNDEEPPLELEPAPAIDATATVEANFRGGEMIEMDPDTGEVLGSIIDKISGADVSAHVEAAFDAAQARSFGKRCGFIGAPRVPPIESTPEESEAWLVGYDEGSREANPDFPGDKP